MRKVLLLIVVAIVAGVAGWNVWTARKHSESGAGRAVFAELGMPETTRPVLAATENGNLYMLAVDTATKRLMLAMSYDGGDAFMPPMAISPAGAAVMSQGENGPSLFVRGMSVYAVWQQSREGGGSDVVFARSGRMGEPFSAPLRVADKPLTDRSYNGFSRLGVAPNGDIYIVWLDGRDKADPEGTFSLYMVKSTDHGATFGKNIRIASGVCPCCRPAIAFGEQGEVIVSWRKVFAGDIRDMVVAVSSDGGQSFRAPVKAGTDDWVLHACPDSGPALAVLGKRLYASWFSQGKGGPGIRVSYSDDGGQSFSAPVIVSNGIEDANHPVFATGFDGSLALVFQGRTESASGRTRPRPYVVAIKGDASAAAVPVPWEYGASYPEIALGTQVTYVAWTAHDDQERSSVRLASLPR